MPNGNDQTVIFGNAITRSRTVFTDDPVTVRSIQFENTNTYVVSGSGSVELESGSVGEGINASVGVAQGSHQFQAIVNVRSRTDINIESGATLTFNNALNLNANILTKTGAGTVAINNVLASGGGTLDCAQGTCSGAGTVGGDLNNSGGTIAPGNSTGILTVSGNLDNGSHGTIAIEIEGTDGAGKPQGHDQIQVTGSSTLDGTLRITTTGVYADPTTRTARDTFTVIASHGGSTGTFGTVSYDDTDLSADFNVANGSFRDPIANGLFRNVNYDGNDVNVTNLLALQGDADGDKDIDITDFNILASNFDDSGANSATNDWTTADFDADGDIDITDFNALASNFADTGYKSTHAVPEPSSFALHVFGIFALTGFASWRKLR